MDSIEKTQRHGLSDWERLDWVSHCTIALQAQLTAPQWRGAEVCVRALRTWHGSPLRTPIAAGERHTVGAVGRRQQVSTRVVSAGFNVRLRVWW